MAIAILRVMTLQCLPHKVERMVSNGSRYLPGFFRYVDQVMRVAEMLSGVCRV